MKLCIALIIILISCSSVLSLLHAFSPGSDGSKLQIRDSKHRVRREVRSVTFEVDGEDFSFNFERSERQVYARDIPVYLVKSNPGSTPNYTYEHIPNTDSILSKGFFYIDNAKKAVAYVHYDENNRDIIYDGLFGEDPHVHLIESLSESQKAKIQRHRQERNQINHRGPRRNPYLPSSGNEGKWSKRSNERPIDPRELLEKPLDIFYPKLLVLVDNRLFKYHNSNISKIVQYVATFWNAVDQKYVELDAPKVELSVTGIIIANDEDAFNYLQMGKLDPKEYGKDELGRAKYHTDYINSNMSEYFRYNFSKDVDFRNYDVAVLMSAVDMNGYGGITFPEVICSSSFNTIVVRDQGWFDGVHTATHELAHALGAYHDGVGQPSGCPSRDNNKGVSVMNRGTELGEYYYWSDCTKRYFCKFATKKTAACLATRHRERHFDKNYT